MGSGSDHGKKNEDASVKPVRDLNCQSAIFVDEISCVRISGVNDE